MKIERLILPLAAASIVIGLISILGPKASALTGVVVVALYTARSEANRRRREEVERRYRIRVATWKAGDRRWHV